MRIAVLKLGARISYSHGGSSGGTGEALSIMNLLRPEHKLIVFTKIISSDVNPSDVEFRNIEDHSDDVDYDAMIVFNGNVNFFGGKEEPIGLHSYKMIKNFQGKIYYIFCDPNLYFQQIEHAVRKKEWASNWPDLTIPNYKVNYIAQPYDVDKLFRKPGKQDIIPNEIVHFPFEQFPCMEDTIPMFIDPFTDGWRNDLVYGGTFRGGRREKKMIKFYFDHPEDISVEMFGKIDYDDFNPKLVGDKKHPSYGGVVNYSVFNRKMNSNLATCVIGDPFYEETNDIPQRVYESIWSNVVTFVDWDMDARRRIFGSNKELSEFLYVRTREELTTKIRRLKNEGTLREEILKEQIKTVNFEPSKYCHQLSELIKA